VWRWLGGDPTLAEPAEQGVAASFERPYKLGGELCNTPQELAAALGRHWTKGAADIGNGQLLSWFRDVHKDQDTVRLLLEMQHEKQMHIDVQLLRLIVHLAPELPPVWRGESIELRAILEHASAALKPDKAAADAAKHWLDTLFKHGVLQFRAEAGDTEAATLVQRWTGEAARFTQAWAARRDFIGQQLAKRHPTRVVNFDDLVFGNSGFTPPLGPVHPRLLAMAYDPAYADKLRKRLAVELTPILVRCPWMTAGLGEVAKMSPADLLATETLLPDLRKAADQEDQANAQKQAAHDGEAEQLRIEVRDLFAAVRGGLAGLWPAEEDCENIEAALVQLFDMLARLRAGGATSPAWVTLMQQMNRMEPALRQMHTLLGELMRRRAASRMWVNWGTIGAALFALIFTPRPFAWFRYLALALLIIVPAWRLWPAWSTAHELRELARSLRLPADDPQAGA
jgi:hypothetical protein